MITDTDVVIVGGGPNGLMLACELALAGVQPVVLESLTAPSQEPKANGLLGQVVRMIDRRGLYERLSGAAGPPRPNSASFMFAAMGLNLSLLPESPIYGLPATQHHIVQILQERAAELGVEIRRGHQVVELSQDDKAVTVNIASAEGTYQLQTRFAVGADGAHSVTRKQSGIGFPGISYDRRTNRTAHATVPAAWVDSASGALNVPGYGSILPFLPQRTERGGFTYAPLPGHPPLISTTEWDQPEAQTPMSLDELGVSIRQVLGADVPLGPPTGEGPHVLRRMTGGNTRVAERFRDRRVFLVGDAAHVYTAGGGPGLNLGLQDAINLGWKLAAEIRGGAPSDLLDSYETERRQAATRMVVNAQAQAALTAPGSDVTALRELFAELLDQPNTVQHLADLTAGSDIRYAMGGSGETHPLVGRFAPDLDLRTPTGTVRLAEITRTARPLLLDLTPDASVAGALTEWLDRVDIITAQPQPQSPAPAPALAPKATALLIRPDCYVAWASASPRPDPAELDALRAAAEQWFGAASRSRPAQPARSEPQASEPRPDRSEADRRLTDPEVLVNSFSSQVLKLLNEASDPAARLAAAVYRQSIDLHRQAGPAVRRQVLALDAARFGDRELAARITAVPVKGEPAAQWGVEWATGSGADSRFWPAETGHTGQVTAVATADVQGRAVAVSGGEDNTVRSWDLATGQVHGDPLTSDNGPDTWVTALATCVLAGRPIAVAGSWDASLRVWDLTTGRPSFDPLTGHDGPIGAVATAELNGRPVAVTGGHDRSVRVWDLTTGQPLGGPLTGHNGRVEAIATATVNGQPIALTVGGEDDGTVRMWDLTTGRPLGEPLHASVRAVATTVLNGRPVAVTGSHDQSVRVWDLTTGHPLGHPLTGHDGSVRAVATTTLNGRPVAITGSDDGTVRLWDLTASQQTGREFAFPHRPSSLAVSPNHRIVVGFSHDVATLTRR